MEPNKAEFNRQSDGTFGPGNNANPLGRPKGKSLKEYWKQRFSDMTDEEKEEFSKKVAPELLWQMAEGRPITSTDITTNGESLTPLLVKIIGKDEHNGDTNGV